MSIGMAEEAGWGGAGRAGGAHPAACVSAQSGSLQKQAAEQRNRFCNRTARVQLL